MLKKLTRRRLLVTVTALAGITFYAWARWVNSCSPFTLGIPLPMRSLATFFFLPKSSDHEGDRDYWIQNLLDAETSSLAAPEVVDVPEMSSGKLLPLSFYDPPWATDDYSPLDSFHLNDNLFKGKIVVRTTKEYVVYRRMAMAIDWLRRHEDTEVIAWMARQSQKLPPQRIDTLVYYSSRYTFRNCSPDFWSKTRTEWQKMANSPNPAYRLLAACYGAQWCEGDSGELAEVCARSFNEYNVAFAEQAVGSMQSWLRALDSPKGLPAVGPPPSPGQLLELESSVKRFVDRRKVYGRDRVSALAYCQDQAKSTFSQLRARLMKG